MSDIFNNTEIAYLHKNNRELSRAFYLFKILNNKTLVNVGSYLTNFAINTKLPVEKLIQWTVFDHFCGGISEEECMPKVNRMFEKGLNSILDYSVEGKNDESSFNASLNKILDLIDFVKTKREIPFVVFKPTALGRLDLYQKKGLNENFTSKEAEEWEKIIHRFESICEKSSSNKVKILIDAEESWMQDAADILVETMMQKYNKQNGLIYNTVQMYRSDRLDYIKKLTEKAKTSGFMVGLKLVRGAYMEKENQRAIKNYYQTPICKSKEASDANFDAALDFVMSNIDHISIFAGTHNEKSTYKLMKLMEMNGIQKSDERIWFCQLFGMSDNISYRLSGDGYNVAKYIPYGPIKEVLPYLLRRAKENTSVAGQTNRELLLLNREQQRRKHLKSKCSTRM